mmetsp:Transcript_15649/g.39906  ORF Transcript_15649/g.39906 Transcript_15649/m.39906 type:complete len:84 (+) Transcript_15649:359-610(+)
MQCNVLRIVLQQKLFTVPTKAFWLFQPSPLAGFESRAIRCVFVLFLFLLLLLLQLLLLFLFALDFFIGQVVLKYSPENCIHLG